MKIVVKKKLALGVFVDIVIAFDYVIFRDIFAALKGLDLSRFLLYK